MKFAFALMAAVLGGGAAPGSGHAERGRGARGDRRGARPPGFDARPDGRRGHLRGRRADRAAAGARCRRADRAGTGRPTSASSGTCRNRLCRCARRAVEPEPGERRERRERRRLLPSASFPRRWRRSWPSELDAAARRGQPVDLHAGADRDRCRQRSRAAAPASAGRELLAIAPVRPGLRRGRCLRRRSTIFCGTSCGDGSLYALRRRETAWEVVGVADTWIN